MSYEQAVANIRAYFDQQWGSLTKVQFDDDGKFKIPPNKETWVRLNIQHMDGFQASTGAPGSNKFRREGLVTVQVFQPQGQYSKDARQKADAVVNIFEAKPRITGILFSDVTVKEIGSDGAGFYQINVKANFQYDIAK